MRESECERNLSRLALARFGQDVARARSHSRARRGSSCGDRLGTAPKRCTKLPTRVYGAKRDTNWQEAKAWCNDSQIAWGVEWGGQSFCSSAIMNNWAKDIVYDNWRSIILLVGNHEQLG